MMMKSRPPYSFARRGLPVAGLLLLILFGGCSDATEAQDPGSSKIPGVGSSFSTHIFFQNDSITLEDDVDVVVGAADMIVEGKERVVQYVADTLSTLLCYELNGDISVYMKRATIAGCEVENTWLRFPFGEQGGGRGKASRDADRSGRGTEGVPRHVPGRAERRGDGVRQRSAVPDA